MCVCVWGGGGHLDLSRCPLLHKVCNLHVLRTYRVMIQPESSGSGVGGGGGGGGSVSVSVSVVWMKSFK